MSKEKTCINCGRKVLVGYSSVIMRINRAGELEFLPFEVPMPEGATIERLCYECQDRWQYHPELMQEDLRDISQRVRLEQLVGLR